MALDSAWNMYIFRDGKSVFRGADLLQEFLSELGRFGDASAQSDRNAFFDLLLRAGELECALADSDSRYQTLAATITDEFSGALLTGSNVQGSAIANRAALITAPDSVTLSTPEGFAYYALHPLDFADLARRFESHSRYAAVIGIRSIGTTLSSIVQATLRTEGLHVERTTVRPQGHPYERKTVFTPSQLQWIATMRSHRADFYVIDEGPGMSGSSFLSVGDALLSAGVDRSQISFAGTRQPVPETLTAAGASSRWPAFRFYCTAPTRHLPKGAYRYIAGGIWRADVFASESDWPASWLQMERLKFRSKDERTFYRFEGFGRFGAGVHDRTIRVAEAGFGPLPHAREEGFGVYRSLHGRTLSACDASPDVLQRIAEYCTFRDREFAVAHPDNRELANMLRFNAKEELGVELPQDACNFDVTRPVIVDGRMLPHKWLDCDGKLIKFDCASHGDDHFFPGPTDIAWDLAGTIVEWDLDEEQSHAFLQMYENTSGKDARPRLSPYLLGYAVFRMAYSKMAAASMRGSEEEIRLTADYQKYRGKALMLLPKFEPVSVEVRSAAEPVRAA